MLPLDPAVFAEAKHPFSVKSGLQSPLSLLKVFSSEYNWLHNVKPLNYDPEILNSLHKSATDCYRT